MTDFFEVASWFFSGVVGTFVVLGLFALPLVFFRYYRKIRHTR